jgi:hypothetical protein
MYFFYNIYLGSFHHVFPGCFLVLSIFWPRQSWAWWPLPLQTSFISWQTFPLTASSVSWLMLPWQTSSMNWGVPLNICGRLVSPPFKNILHHLVNSSFKETIPSASSSSGPPSSWRGTARQWRFFFSVLHFRFYKRHCFRSGQQHTWKIKVTKVKFCQNLALLFAAMENWRVYCIFSQLQCYKSIRKYFV